MASDLRASWIEEGAFQGSVGRRSGTIRLGVLTATNHHYLEVPDAGIGEPMYHLVEESSDGPPKSGQFQLIRIPDSVFPDFTGASQGLEDQFVPDLTIYFQSDADHDSFVRAYSAAWEKEMELKASENAAIEAALADAIEGEQRLLQLREDEVAETLSWFRERDSSGGLLRACVASTAGTRRDSLRAVLSIGGPFESQARSGSASWNVDFMRGKAAVPKPPARRGLPFEQQRQLAIAASTDVEMLKHELGGIDPKVKIDWDALPEPQFLPRRTAGRESEPGPPMRLLDIACGAGKCECFRFLFMFCGITPTAESMRQALASQNNELVRDLWNRLPETDRKLWLVSFGRVAAEFHNGVAFP